MQSALLRIAYIRCEHGRGNNLAPFSLTQVEEWGIGSDNLIDLNRGTRWQNPLLKPPATPVMR